jgi:AcrR family transcriptional regulator
MNRARGRPVQGSGLSRADILSAALALLDESGGQGLTMRTLAARLAVTPMSLYRHVGGRDELVQALSEMVYADVLEGTEVGDDPEAQVRGVLIRYHQTICRHPQLTLAIFSTPEALAGVTRHITDRLTLLLTGIAAEPTLWQDLLIDHAHGSGLASAFAAEGPMRVLAIAQYRNALDRLLEKLSASNDA